jgi:hypothetical protein
MGNSSLTEQGDAAYYLRPLDGCIAVLRASWSCSAAVALYPSNAQKPDGTLTAYSVEKPHQAISGFQTWNAVSTTGELSDLVLHVDAHAGKFSDLPAHSGKDASFSTE